MSNEIKLRVFDGKHPIQLQSLNVDMAQPPGRLQQFLQRQRNDASKSSYHLYCSPHNPAAEKVVQEINQILPKGSEKLRRTTEIEDMSKCEHMLILLDSETWQSDSHDHSADAFAKEVSDAMKIGLHRLLVHESIAARAEHEEIRANEKCRKRLGCPFEDIKHSTPEHLQAAGLYSAEIAVTLAGGEEWREAGLTSVYQQIAKGVGGPAPKYKVDTSKIPKDLLPEPAQLPPPASKLPLLARKSTGVEALREDSRKKSIREQPPSTRKPSVPLHNAAHIAHQGKAQLQTAEALASSCSSESLALAPSPLVPDLLLRQSTGILTLREESRHRKSRELPPAHRRSQQSASEGSNTQAVPTSVRLSPVHEVVQV
eukprot:CAMPEP_0181199656 /NCGR_PEP_ID=MMETSP1096-20121128/17294_1 /TAXON_ID=156174 ORGANISM="Chrysochromulina ericina, Strain CCMP281" /NCGR_SAMPLE_ID=MMETSP1096 /ASSEMBLY_ACC=CAM_ASM_000453 /LENGTH=370 /DNA_ID=CAMNT_0023289855 /DNA_START=82 /DNA_END=1194 /DNA_ORIENTATION=+